MRRGKDFWSKRWEQLSEQIGIEAERKDLDAHAIWKNPDPSRIDAVVNRYSRVEEFIKTELERLGVEPESLLDVGTGTGHWVEFFHEAFGIEFEDMLATDLVDEPLEFVKRRFPGIRVAKLDLAVDDLPKSTAQIGTAIGVLHHVTSQAGLRVALRELGEAVDLLFIFPVYEGAVPEPRHYKKYWTLNDYTCVLENLCVIAHRRKVLLLGKLE